VAAAGSAEAVAATGSGVAVTCRSASASRLWEWAISPATVRRIRSMSGRDGSISGGENAVEASGSERPDAANSRSRAMSPPGMSVVTIAPPASASAVKRVATVTGLACLASALITHFWRVIRS
jgi:hypothetical protein